MTNVLYLGVSSATETNKSRLIIAKHNENIHELT